MTKYFIFKRGEFKSLMGLSLFLFFIILILPAVNAEPQYSTFALDSLPSVKKGMCVSLPQIDFNATSQNITFIKLPNGTNNAINVPMISIGEYSWEYEYCDTDLLGNHQVNGCSDIGCWNYGFEVTPQGQESSNSNITLFIILIILLYTISFVGFFGKNEWVAMLGGMSLIALGIYTINNGIIIYQDFITNVFSWTTIGIGAFFALSAGLEVIQENL
jgi:hypothetical protein